MNFKKSAIMLSFAAAMALLNTTTFAIDMSSSQVIKTTGKVAVKKTDSPEFKKLNSNLKLAGALKNLNGGDKVRTFINSTADLALKDTCILMVKEQSIFEIPKVLTQQDLKTLVAQQGSVLFKVAKGSNFQVQTADVICGVKGTMFDITLVDDLDTMLETPGLQIGYKKKSSGTSINVYEGEVQVTNNITKENKSLKKGEGLFIQKGTKIFNNIYKFVSDSELKRIWGNDSLKFLNNNNLNKLQWYGSLENYNSLEKLGSNPDLKNYITDHNKSSYSNDHIKNATIIFGEGEKYKLDLSRFNVLDSEKIFTNNAFGEVYLGNSTFASCKASNGSTSFIVEPGQSGLVIIQGNGLVRIDGLDTSSIKPYNKLLANIYENNNSVITVVNNENNNLYWREPGSLKIQQVPIKGEAAFLYNRNTCQGAWLPAQKGSISNDLLTYKNTQINSIEQSKRQVEKRNEEKKTNAAYDSSKKIVNEKVKNTKAKETINKGLDTIFKKGKKGRFGF